ncbi:MaoC family dehydratase [Streptomyces sp. NPDC058284]|uniref:MaoC family dehydratase n=1 Tax=unclassified Streptomyces TaxID=2593676 RepID=UPI0036512344
MRARTPLPLPLLLLRAAALSPLKHPGAHPHAPRTRLTATRTPDPRHLTAYNTVCGFGFPTNTGTSPEELPLTYPHVLAFPLAMRLMTARDFPLPLLGLVHTSIEITQYRPPHPSEKLELTVGTRQLTPHRRGTEATLTTQVTSTRGELLWQSDSTYLARHKTPPQAPSPTPSPTPTPTPAPAPTPAAGTQWHLAPDLGRRYAAVSGDRNPIHLHPLTARPFGFPRPIAHGMWTFARCLAENGAQGAVRVRAEFKAPVLLPSTVTYTARDHTFELHDPRTGKPHLTGETSEPPSPA